MLISRVILFSARTKRRQQRQRPDGRLNELASSPQKNKLTNKATVRDGDFGDVGGQIAIELPDSPMPSAIVGFTTMFALPHTQ